MRSARSPARALPIGAGAVVPVAGGAVELHPDRAPPCTCSGPTLGLQRPIAAPDLSPSVRSPPGDRWRWCRKGSSRRRCSTGPRRTGSAFRQWSRSPQHRDRAAAGAGLPGHRRRHAEHPRSIHGRRRAQLHECTARRRLRQPVVVMKAGRRPPSQVALTHWRPSSGTDDVFDSAKLAPAWCGCASSQPFSGRAVSHRFRPVGRRWPSSPTAAGHARLPPTGPTRSSSRWATCATSARSRCQDHVQALGAAVADRDRRRAAHPFAQGRRDPMASPKPPACTPSAAKPVVGCWLGQTGNARRAPDATVQHADVPHALHAEPSMRSTASPASTATSSLTRQNDAAAAVGPRQPDTEGAFIVEAVFTERRSVLTEMESKALLAAFRIPSRARCWRAAPTKRC